MGRRKRKGEVSLHNDKGNIRLRWRFNAERYSLNLRLPYRRSYLGEAKKIADTIEDDIYNKQFDPSLIKYKNFKGAESLPVTTITRNVVIDSDIRSVTTQDLLVREIAVKEYNISTEKGAGGID